MLNSLANIVAEKNATDNNKFEAVCKSRKDGEIKAIKAMLRLSLTGNTFY